MFGFVRYEYLWLLALLPFLGIMLIYFYKVRCRRLKRLEISLKSYELQLRVVLPMFTALIFLLALARPYWGYEQFDRMLPGQDIMLAVDISLSMKAADNNPSRLAFAKRKIEDIIDHLEDRAVGDRIGMVLFAGESYLFAPITADYPVARQFSREISTSLIERGGSKINLAIETAVANLRNPATGQGRIILLSDGEDSQLHTGRAIRSLTEAEVQLDALGFGTVEGSPINIEGVYLRDRSGELVVSRLEEEAMRQMAEASGGQYVRASFNRADIEILFDTDTGPYMSGDPERSEIIYIYNEIGPFLLWIPLFLFLLNALIFRREALLLCLLLLSTDEIYAQNEKATPLGSLREAHAAYKEGNFQKARNIFERHYRSRPDNAVLQALASSEYKLGNFDRSANLFSQLAENSKSGREKFEATYNLGNSFLMGGKPGEAIKSYEQSLRIKENDKKALHNLAIAKKLLESQPPQISEDKEQEMSTEDDDDKMDSEEPESDTDDTEPKADADVASPETQEGDETQQSLDSGQSDESGEGEQDPIEQEDSEPDAPQPEGTDTDSEIEAEFEGEHSNEGSDYDKSDQLEHAEAEAWLQSLPDSPLLIRRKRGTSRFQDEQQW